MLDVSNEWKDNIYNSTEKKLRIEVNNTILDDDDIQGTLEIQETCTNSKDIKIGSCIASSLKFNLTNKGQNVDFLNNDINVYVGIKIPSSGQFEFVPMGIFLFDEIDDKDERVLKITCRDKMKLFDKDCTEFLATRTYPITLWNLTQQLCNYVGIELENTSIVNGNYLIDNNFNAMSVTGQQILSWIGEVAASFVNVNRYGKLVFKMFTATPETSTYFYGAQPTEIELIKEIEVGVTSRDYINITAAKYTVPQITRVQVAVKDDDLGVIVGTGNITYSIINNPLLYTKSEAQITPAMTNILNQLKSIPVYTPAKVYGKGNPALETGDIISVSTVKGQEVNVLVMDRKFVYQKSFRDTYESFGTTAVGEKRIVQSNVIQLKGKMNILTRTLEENTLRIEDVEQGYSEISQTVDELSIEIVDIDLKSISTYNQTSVPEEPKSGDIWYNSGIDYTVDKLTMTVNEMIMTVDELIFSPSSLKRWNGEEWEVIEDTNVLKDVATLNIRADEIEAKVTSVEGNVGELIIQSDEIALRVSGAENSLTEIKLTTDGIEAAVNASKLTFDDTFGLTIYNGGFRIIEDGDEVFTTMGGTLSIKGSLHTGEIDGAVHILDSGIYFTDLSGVTGERNSLILNGDYLMLSSNKNLVFTADKEFIFINREQDGSAVHFTAPGSNGFNLEAQQIITLKAGTAVYIDAPILAGSSMEWRSVGGQQVLCLK